MAKRIGRPSKATDEKAKAVTVMLPPFYLDELDRLQDEMRTGDAPKPSRSQVVRRALDALGDELRARINPRG